MGGLIIIRQRWLILIWECLIWNFAFCVIFIFWICINFFRFIWCLVAGINYWIWFIVSWLSLICLFFSLVGWIYNRNCFVFICFSFIFNIQVFFVIFSLVGWVHNRNCLVFIGFSFIFYFNDSWIINFISFIWRINWLGFIFLVLRNILCIVVYNNWLILSLNTVVVFLFNLNFSWIFKRNILFSKLFFCNNQVFFSCFFHIHSF